MGLIMGIIFDFLVLFHRVTVREYILKKGTNREIMLEAKLQKIPVIVNMKSVGNFQGIKKPTILMGGWCDIFF